MRVQRVIMPVTEALSWTLLGDEGEPVEPVESFLAFLSGLERSPNTVRDRAMSLKLWFEFLDRSSLRFDDVGVDDVARFVAWLLARKNAELERERERGERLAMAEERARIAREVHDVLAHTVSVMVVQAEAAEELLERDVGQTRQRLVAIETTGREALGEIRHLLGMLRNDGANSERLPQPGLGQVEALVGQFRDAGLTVTLTCEGERKPLPPGLDLCAYRIVQEALTNTLKHAGPTAVTVMIRHGDNALELDLEDDGPGAEGGEGGHGLLGIRERVGMYGGTLSFGNRDEGGFGVHARFPYPDGPE